MIAAARTRCEKRLPRFACAEFFSQRNFERIVPPCTILSSPFALRAKGAYHKPLPASYGTCTKRTGSNSSLPCGNHRVPVIKYSHTTRTGQKHCLCAFFTLHRLINRKERKALSFAQLRKGIIVMSLWIGTRQSKSTEYLETLNRPGFLRAEPLSSAGKRGGYRGRKNPALNGVFSPPN